MEIREIRVVGEVERVEGLVRRLASLGCYLLGVLYSVLVAG